MLSKLRRLLAVASALLVVAMTAHAAAEAPRHIASHLEGVAMDVSGETDSDAPSPTNAPEGFEHEAPGGGEHAFVATDESAPWRGHSLQSILIGLGSAIPSGLILGTHERPPRAPRT